MIQEFVVFLERRCSKRLLRIRADNAEATQTLQAFCDSKGIELVASNRYEHNDNPAVERLHRTINEMAATFLQDANLPMRYWGYAVQHALYVKNRLPMKVLGWRTPYEALLNEKPDLQYLHRFGSRCFVHIPTELQMKMGPRSEEGIYLGNTPNGYLVKLRESGKLSRARSVVFDESFERPALNMEEFVDSSSDNNYSEYEDSG
jgi:hypothetical protein